jgi:transcription elongation factor Elf1
MALSMFNQLTYRFTCPHCGHPEAIVLSRLDGVTEWECERCHKATDFRKEPHKSEIDTLRRTASESDKQAMQRGEKRERLRD